ncbi:MAG: hypothetical protein KGJ02_02075 [Verrucomicrobiota bacterium]|nr:hypothetical protein [Verrucomicrobiota bacterium]
MLSSICSSIRSCGSFVVDKIDHAAIRLNRCSSCVRKTVFTATMLLGPNGFFNGALFALFSQVKIPDGAVSPIIVFGDLLPLCVTTWLIFKNYSWLDRPKLGGSEPCWWKMPPERIRVLLAAEAANGDLPEAYRAEITQLIDLMDREEAAAEELTQLQPTQSPA